MQAATEEPMKEKCQHARKDRKPQRPPPTNDLLGCFCNKPNQVMGEGRSLHRGRSHGH